MIEHTHRQSETFRSGTHFDVSPKSRRVTTVSDEILICHIM